MRISKLSKLTGAAVLLGLIAILAFGWATIRELKVGGPVYNRIVLGKDLVADILPPPAYLVEAFMEASLARFEPQDIAEHKTKLAALRKDFDARHAFWKTQDFDPAVRTQFLEQTHKPAIAFWEIVDNKLMPALEKSDAAATQEAYSELRKVFSEHRAEIVETVKRAEGMMAQVEASAASSEAWYLALIIATTLGVIGMISAAVGAGLLGVIRPLDQMARSLSDLALGNTDVEFVGKGRNDEIGELAAAADVFRENAIQRARLEESQRVARERENYRQERVEELVESFKSKMSNLVSILERQVASMRSVAGVLTQTAQQTFTQANSAAQSTTGAADNSRAVASATEELQASIKEISAQAHQTNQIVTDATTQTHKTDADVASLAEATERIGSVVELIRSIAQQTNLLALNATIESARAGEAGKGFAVVANEVKHLASQTSRATDEISNQITEVQSKTRLAVEAIRDVSSKVNEINGLTGAIAAAVEQQEAATREIAHNVTLAADRSNSAADNVGQLSEAADNTKQEAEQVSSVSLHLASVSHDMQAALQQFVEALSSDLADRRTALRERGGRQASVTCNGRTVTTEVSDRSSLGARVRVIDGLSPQMSVEVDFGEGRLPANVVWVKDGFMGLSLKSVTEGEKGSPELKHAA